MLEFGLFDFRFIILALNILWVCKCRCTQQFNVKSMFNSDSDVMYFGEALIWYACECHINLSCTPFMRYKRLRASILSMFRTTSENENQLCSSTSSPSSPSSPSTFKFEYRHYWSPPSGQTINCLSFPLSSSLLRLIYQSWANCPLIQHYLYFHPKVLQCITHLVCDAH